MASVMVAGQGAASEEGSNSGGATHQAGSKYAQCHKPVHLKQNTPFWVPQAINDVPNEPPDSNRDHVCVNERVFAIQITLQGSIAVQQRISSSDARIQPVGSACDAGEGGSGASGM